MKALAEHIKTAGYDVTRAVKVHRTPEGLKVFAGSTRLKACEIAGVEAVPAFEFNGYSDGELWKLAYDDNEADGKHSTLPITDVWADYAKRHEAGMKQEEIAEALGVKQTMVSYRIRFHSLPKSIKSAVINDKVLSEYALTQISPLINALIEPLSDWMTGDQLLEYVANQCINMKADEKLRKDFIARAKKMAETANNAYEALPEGPRCYV